MVCVCVCVHLNCLYMIKICRVMSPGSNDITFVEAYPLVALREEVFPRRTHHLGEVKDRNGAFWVG